MKYIGFLLMIIGFGALSGCSITSFQETVKNSVRDMVAKDQQHEQGFVLSAAEVIEAFDQASGVLDLSKRGLIGIPDLCTLLPAQYHDKVLAINLMSNDIRIVDEDLGCFLNLEEVNLSYNNIKVLETLGDLPSLKKLLLHKNELSSLDLPDFPVLEELNLGYNQLKEVMGLEKLQNLKTLELQHNLLEKVIGVEYLAKLKELKLEFNKLGDISFIDKLDNLILITAKGNELKDSVMEKLQSLNDSYVATFLVDQIGTGMKGVLKTKVGTGG